MDRINLRNMAFYGYHGNLPSENELGQRFFVDISIGVDLTKPGQSDSIEDSINYADVYERTKAIVDDLWNTYQGIVGLSVTVRKPEAPIPGVLDYVEVVITRGQL